MANQQPEIDVAAFTRREREPWMCGGKNVRCSSCGEEIGGRLLLRKIDSALFGMCPEPSCIECLIEEAVAHHGFIDVGVGPTKR
jgi:hypothetical protein